MKFLKVVVIFVAVLVLNACAGLQQTIANLQDKGKDRDPVLCQQIKPGITTISQVETESLLGKPSGIEGGGRGEIRYYGDFVVRYDKKGKVIDYVCKKS